ncbi:hypothetical protein Tco_1166245 [Tanacetum coccineum]
MKRWKKRVFKGVKIGADNVVVSHLQCFEEVSGLRVNYNKSKLYGVGVNEEELRDMARWMKCGTDDFPFSYLGLSIGQDMRRVGA